MPLYEYERDADSCEAHGEEFLPRQLRRSRGFAALGLVVAAYIWFQSALASAGNSFFPLWQKNPPNAVDTVLVYQGGSGRLPWTPEQFKPYVSYHDPRDSHEKWLFDGFLFIEYHDRKRTFSGTEGKGKWTPADKNDWLKLLDKNFEVLADGHHYHGVPALEQCCAETEKHIGTPLRQRQVILTLPEPVENFTNWGELNGRKLDFSVLSDRVAACDWYVSRALDKWHALAPKHLTLAGFYFVPESITDSNRQMLPLVSQKIHARGLRFFWIPSWHTNGVGDWKALGFDLASQQPNYFFHPELPESHLQTACDFGRTNGMGMEMEFDGRLINQTILYSPRSEPASVAFARLHHLNPPKIFRPRFDAYLKAFADNGVKDSAAISYYEGGGTILRLAQAYDKAAHSYYDRIAQWVVDRQLSADNQFQRATKIGHDPMSQ